MLYAYIISIIITIVAFIYVNLICEGKYFGTAVPIIVDLVSGIVLVAGAIAVICLGNIKAAAPSLVMAFYMFARAYIDYQTMRDAKDFFERWGRRG